MSVYVIQLILLARTTRAPWFYNWHVLTQTPSTQPVPPKWNRFHVEPQTHFTQLHIHPGKLCELNSKICFVFVLKVLHIQMFSVNHSSHLYQRPTLIVSLRKRGRGHRRIRTHAHRHTQMHARARAHTHTHTHSM